MSKIPKVSHEIVKDPNTDQQWAIAKAVEELFPEWKLQEIVNLYEGEDDEGNIGNWDRRTPEQQEKLEQVKSGDRPEEKGAHPSSVTRTVKKYMAPKEETEQGKPGLPNEAPAFESATLTLNIDEDVPAECIRYYVKGKTEGFEEGFDAALEWVENQIDLPEGTIQRGGMNQK